MPDSGDVVSVCTILTPHRKSSRTGKTNNSDRNGTVVAPEVKGLTANGHGEISRGWNVLYFDLGDGDMRVYTCQTVHLRFVHFSVCIVSQ